MIKVWEPLQGLYRYRKLIRLMVKRDLLGRYKGSFAGILWTVLNPLALLLTYWLVFSVILKVPSPTGRSIDFVFFILSGLLPWIAFSESLIRSNTCILENANLVKKVVFPLETLPVIRTLSSGVNSLVGVLLLMILLLGSRGSLPWTVILLPAIFLPQLLLTVGFGWFLASLGVFVRDTNTIIGLVLTVWMFLCPIVYPQSMVPKGLVPWFRLNPFLPIVSGYRNVLIDGTIPGVKSMLFLIGISFLIFFLGYFWFIRTKRAFADVV
ncbi:MAG TPA: ABC transporter permease [Terriglobia bacterium]|nr:ABC transporter permease [Terriglobia bacterium]